MNKALSLKAVRVYIEINWTKWNKLISELICEKNIQFLLYNK